MNFEISNSQPSAEDKKEEEDFEKKEREAGPQTCAELLRIFKKKSTLPEFEQNFTDTDTYTEQNFSHTESGKESADSSLPEFEQNSTSLAAEQGTAPAETDKESADAPISKKLIFEGIEGWDVYNVAPFLPEQADGDERLVVVIGRAERRDTCDSKLHFFKEKKDGTCEKIKYAKVLPLEDGFATNIDGETIVGGVTAYPNSTESDPGRIDYHMVFYRDRGKGLAELEEFTQGPELMKDIRLVELPMVELPESPKSPKSRIAAFTRPTGGDNGKGKMAYIELNGLDEINPKKLKEAKVIENQFAQGEWGGANQLYPLPDGRIGVVGHIACIDKPLPGEDKGRRHYYAVSCIYDPDPKKHETTPMEIIATRKNFPKGEAKNTDLQDVVFAGGMVRHGNGKATLYVGLSDAEAGCIEIDDPFWEVEQGTFGGPAQQAEAV